MKRTPNATLSKITSVVSRLLLVIIAAVTLTATNLTQSYFSREGIRREASLRAASELDWAKSEIMNILNQAETAVNNNLRTARWCLSNQDSIWRIPRRLVKDNPILVGAALALVPGYSKDYPLLAPYSYRDLYTGEVKNSSLATDEYDYPSSEWFTMPIEQDGPYWSEPYFDEGGGEMLMVTYSVPVKDYTGHAAAVLTADISLNWLSSVVDSIETYNRALSKITSRLGKEIVSTGGPIEPGEKCQTYSSLVERTGWEMSVTIPETELLSVLKKVDFYVILFQTIGLIMIAVLLIAVARSQKKYQDLDKQREVMQNELKIGHNIQMAMIPKTFPPFPERSDLDFAASIIPAKEVGGDLYDYFIRDEKLFFCIGDVSGKGVPASLVMAVTRSLFRAQSAHEESPAKIMSGMNDSVAETNENNMFVTFFLGVMDLKTGHMKYCNAGHNPPLILTDHIRHLDVVPNVPLGVLPGMDFTEQSIDLHYDDALFLYTDGLTEAENADHDQFGEDRMETVLRERRSSIDHLKAMQTAVEGFVNGAPQSDDLTMLFIHYLPEQSVKPQRHILVIRNEVKQISKLADFVSTIANIKHLSEGEEMNLNLALEEAVTNVVLYAYPKDTEGSVELEAALNGDSLEFTLTDSGKPFDPTAAPQANIDLSVEERPIGGLGIHLVRHIMDEVTYRREGGKNILTMIKKLEIK